MKDELKKIQNSAFPNGATTMQERCSMGNKITSPEYRLWLKGIKERIAASRVKAALSANHELISLYWFLGNQIVEKQESAVWGSGFINQFSRDLSREFPEMKGFSPKNLRYCRAFYNFYSSPAIWQQAVAKLESTQMDECIPRMAGQIPWGHNIHVFSKSRSFEEAIFYIQETIGNGWSRDVLALQIKSNLFERQGKAITNFQQALPSPQSDLAQQTLKDPYSFDFLTLTQPYNERDIENQLISHMSYE